MPTETETTITATEVTTEPDPDEVIPEGLNDGGKAALTAEREARKKAAKEARELKERLTALEAEKAESDRIKAEQDEADAVKRGEFEKLATERAETIKTVSGERDSLKTRLDQALTLLASSVDERWKDVPAEVAELYEGDANDPLAKTAFIERNAKVIAKIKGEQDATQDRFRQASRTRTPPPDTTGKTAEAEEARRRQAKEVSTF